MRSMQDAALKIQIGTVAPHKEQKSAFYTQLKTILHIGVVNN